MTDLVEDRDCLQILLPATGGMRRERMFGYQGKILRVDLTDRKIEVESLGRLAV